MLFKESRISDASALSPELRAIIAEAYDVFAKYVLDRPIGVCHCNVCCSDEHARLLERTPLRQMSSNVLSEYTNSAHGYDETSDGDTLRYFLPRYFELIALNDPPHYGDLCHCLARLGAANYRLNWMPHEADTIDRYFDVLLVDKLTDLALAEWPVGKRLLYPIDELVEMIVGAGGDVDRILLAWQRGSEPGATLHITTLAYNMTWSGSGIVYESAILAGEHDDARRRIGQFVCHPQTLARLEQAVFDLSDRPDLQKIASDGHTFIESLSPSQL